MEVGPAAHVAEVGPTACQGGSGVLWLAKGGSGVPLVRWVWVSCNFTHWASSTNIKTTRLQCREGKPRWSLVA